MYDSSLICTSGRTQHCKDTYVSNALRRLPNGVLGILTPSG